MIYLSQIFQSILLLGRPPHRLLALGQHVEQTPPPTQLLLLLLWLHVLHQQHQGHHHHHQHHQHQTEKHQHQKHVILISSIISNMYNIHIINQLLQDCYYDEFCP